MCISLCIRRTRIAKTTLMLQVTSAAAHRKARTHTGASVALLISSLSFPLPSVAFLLHFHFSSPFVILQKWFTSKKIGTKCFPSGFSHLPSFFSYVYIFTSSAISSLSPFPRISHSPVSKISNTCYAQDTRSCVSLRTDTRIHDDPSFSSLKLIDE